MPSQTEMNILYLHPEYSPVDPVFHRLVGPVSLVHDRVELLVCGDEKQRWESLQRGEHVGDVISCAIQLSKHDVLVGFQKLFGHFLIDWVKLLAVSTPASF